MKKKFQTLFFVKSSLITLYLALTLPIPFISIEALKIISIVLFMMGLVLIVNITSDYVEISNEKIFYKTTSLSNLIGKKSWEIFWKDIKLINSSPTSQGSKVYYFITSENQKFLVPQRVENLEELLSVIWERTGIKTKGMSFISPMWTYKILTLFSLFMIIGEIISFFA
mgnify:CR=1 FL=1|tara:strand:- start:799 stop:1305 length:507 start_codon:yes stop_codon:yes gene_type:complete